MNLTLHPEKVCRIGRVCKIHLVRAGLTAALRMQALSGSDSVCSLCAGSAASLRMMMGANGGATPVPGQSSSGTGTGRRAAEAPSRSSGAVKRLLHLIALPFVCHRCCLSAKHTVLFAQTSPVVAMLSGLLLEQHRQQTVEGCKAGVTGV